MAQKITVSDTEFNLIRVMYVLTNFFLPPIGSIWSSYLHSRKAKSAEEKEPIVPQIAIIHQYAAFFTSLFLLYTLIILTTVTEISLTGSSFFTSLPYVGTSFEFAASLLAGTFAPIAIFFMLLIPILIRTLVLIIQYPPSKTGTPYLKLLKESFIGDDLNNFYEIQKINFIVKQSDSINTTDSTAKKKIIIGCGNELNDTDFRMASGKHMHPEHIHDEYETLDLDNEKKPMHRLSVYDEKQIKKKLKEENYDFVVFERFHGDYIKPKELAEISNYLLKKDGMLAFIAIGRFQFKILSLIENMHANGFKSIILGPGLNCFFFKEGKMEALNIFSSYLNEPYMKKFISGESFFISKICNGTWFDKNNFKNLSWDLDEIKSEAKGLLDTECIPDKDVVSTILKRRFSTAITAERPRDSKQEQLASETISPATNSARFNYTLGGGELLPNGDPNESFNPFS